jgi:hypothetical protein
MPWVQRRMLIHPSASSAKLRASATISWVNNGRLSEGPMPQKASRLDFMSCLFHFHQHCCLRHVSGTAASCELRAMSA